MIRLVAAGALLLILPAIIWWIVRRVRGLRSGVSEAPLADLGLIGVALVIAAVVIIVAGHISRPGGRFIPAHMENGALVPDRFEP